MLSEENYLKLMKKEKNFVTMCEYIRERVYSGGRQYKTIIIYGSIDSEAFETLVSLFNSEAQIYEFSDRVDVLDGQTLPFNVTSSGIISLEHLKEKMVKNPPELIVFGEFNIQLRDFLSLTIRGNRSDVLIVESCVVKLRSLIISLMAMQCYSTKRADQLVENDGMPVFICWA